jgi:hypothetical protein
VKKQRSITDMLAVQSPLQQQQVVPQHPGQL